jgi:hypothetical protein
LLIAGTKTAAKREGPDGWAAFVKAIRDAVPDLNAKIQNLIAEGDYVAMCNTATGTHKGELFGMPRLRQASAHEGLSLPILRRQNRRAPESGQRGTGRRMIAAMDPALIVRSVIAPSVRERPDARHRSISLEA